MVELFSLAEEVPVNGSGGGVEIVGSSHGWIVLLDPNSLEIFLWNPLTSERIDLPPIHNLTIHGGTLESCGGRRCVKKLILSSSNPYDAECRAVMSYGPSSRLVFCCPGHSGAHWIFVGAWWHPCRSPLPAARQYADFAYSTQQNRLICVTASPNPELERWDLRDPCSPMIDRHKLEPYRDPCSPMIEDNKTPRKKVVDYRYVVIAESKVFLVVRRVYQGRWPNSIKDPNKTLGFNIFQVVQGDDHSGKMSLLPVVGFLDGLAMFVGINHSFAISATQFPELNLKPDSVYFTDPTDYLPWKGETCDPPDYLPRKKEMWWSSSYGLGHCDIGIFDYRRQNFYPCSFQGRYLEQYSYEDDSYGDDQGLTLQQHSLLLVWFTSADQI